MTRVIVTRPEREAAQWAQSLAARGLAPVLLPLIEIAPEPDLQPVQAAWQALARGGYCAAMFVSANAASRFFAAKPAGLPEEPHGEAHGTRAWAPGPGTAAALRELGWPEGRIDAPPADGAQFDSEALWSVVGAQVRGRAGSRLLLVRGGDAQGRPAGREWLAQQLAGEGVAVDAVQVYRRRAPVLDEAQCRLAQQSAADGSVWIFSSSEALAHLRSALPAQAWHGARAVATHPRIAQAARDAGFGVVLASAPSLDAVVASIESLR